MVTFTLAELIRMLKIKNLVQDYTLIYIASLGHTTALFKTESLYYYFDPNVGEIEATTVEEIAQNIFKAYTVIITGSTSANTSVDSVLLGFKIFSYMGLSLTEYPQQEEILNELNPAITEQQIPAILKLTGLLGCAESLNYFLNNRKTWNIKKDKLGNALYQSLIYAAQNGHVEVVKILLNIKSPKIDLNPKVSSNKSKPEDMTPLLAATVCGHRDIVELLLECGAKPDTTTVVQVTALMLAAKEGATDTVTLLLNKKADPNKADYNNITALMIAAKYGQLEVVKILLARGAKPGMKSSAGKTAFAFAAEYGQLEVVNTMLTQKSEAISSIERNIDVTPLVLAAQNGHNDIVAVLLNSGNKYRLLSSEDNYALNQAIINNVNLETVDVILVWQIQRVAADNFPEVPIDSWNVFIDNSLYMLEQAATFGRSSIVEDLLDLPTKLKDQLNSLKINSNKQDQIIDKFKEKLLSRIEIVLDSAATRGHLEVIEKILSRVEQISTESIQQILITTMTHNHADITVKLLDYIGKDKVDTAIIINGLLYAVQNGYYNVVKELLDRYPDLIKITQNNKTLLMLAIENKHVDVIIELLEQKIDPNIKIEGQTALTLAVDIGDINSITVLLENDEIKIDSLSIEDAKKLCLKAAINGSVAMIQKLYATFPSLLDDANSSRAFIHAAANGNFEVMQILLEYKSDIATTDAGIEALMTASEHGYVDIVNLLLTNAVDPTIPLNEDTALKVAIKYDKPEIIEELFNNKKIFETLSQKSIDKLLTLAQTKSVSPKTQALLKFAYNIFSLNDAVRSLLLQTKEKRGCPWFRVLSQHLLWQHKSGTAAEIDKERQIIERLDHALAIDDTGKISKYTEELSNSNKTSVLETEIETKIANETKYHESLS